eukprot:4981645-Amphidinium_carterae.1
MSWLSKVISDESEGCGSVGLYIAMPWQLAREGVGMNNNDTPISDMQLGQVSLQTVLKQAKVVERSWKARQPPPQAMPKA